MRLQLFALKNQLCLEQPIIYISSPVWCGIEKNFNYKLLCYDYYDEYSEFHHMPAEKTDQVVTGVLKKSDIVFASAQSLEKKALRFNANSYYVPNAVVYATFFR